MYPVVGFRTYTPQPRKCDKLEHRAMRISFVRYIDHRLFDRLNPAGLQAYFDLLKSSSVLAQSSSSSSTHY